MEIRAGLPEGVDVERKETLREKGNIYILIGGRGGCMDVYINKNTLNFVLEICGFQYINFTQRWDEEKLNGGRLCPGSQLFSCMFFRVSVKERKKE